MLSQESDVVAFTSAATSLASAFTFSTVVEVLLVLEQLDISRAAAPIIAARRRRRRDVVMICGWESWTGGSLRRLLPKDMGQRRYDKKDEEDKEENPGYLRGRAGDAGEPDGGGDCHDEEDDGPA